MRLISWYRDRILHNGSKLPSLWLLDYIVTQQLLPIVNDILTTEKNILDESTFYLKTQTGIEILGEFLKVKYDFKDLQKADNQTFKLLLKIGHLKELGRANLNMNLFVRGNHRATFEYNYDDPKGRGERFAVAEKSYKHFKEIKNCPCCGQNSLVLYENVITFIDVQHIQWVKCYTCDYHIRYNVGDPYFFGLSNEKIFS